ncbi:MAG: ubiquinol-cytochrome C chaperone [Alphaproteobacteria bacterium]|nr:ubiquinol-cytochrome C chaperone [Alphaproteobacteria bacterium]MDE2012468.1 ubiquinol-cytochrome C chaperone [Alphaproteobacteria bacterium]MDE2074607.1 ubiquinol-cytochrome C chaperone [Alphaproteobacteria bacterium]MDE2351860.1 ubiquinol-cytochrome C chaperone [Alphaproteobacteria bacterium]
MLNVLWRGAASRKAAESLAAGITARARAPVFFRDLGVADSFDGRFDMVALHGWLAMDRLQAQGARAVVQALVNTLFEGFEDALREQGAGDIGMGRRMKKIADAFYGRLKAYGEAAETGALAEALLRNVYRGEAQDARMAGWLADYALAARVRLAAANVAGGDLEFGPLPGSV